MPIHPKTIVQERRRQTYNIAQQLELIFKDIEEGLFGEQAKKGQFYQYILSVKQQFPLPNEPEKTHDK